MKITQRDQLAQRFVTLAADRAIGDFEQPIGRFAHGRDNYNGPPVEPRFYDSGNALDGLGRFDGGSAEFHDDH
jgi:hypothetical protein